MPAAVILAIGPRSRVFQIDRGDSETVLRLVWRGVNSLCANPLGGCVLFRCEEGTLPQRG